MKKVWSILLCLALCLGMTTALAAGTQDLFPKTQEYPGFADVADTAWYAPYVRVCYETGMMSGTDKGFNPDGTMAISETAAIAARIASTLSGTPIVQPDNAPYWYSGAMNYMKELSVAASNDLLEDVLGYPDVPSSRAILFSMLTVAVPREVLIEKNAITDLPDVTNDDVLAFYNAGILSGVNPYGTFAGSRTLTRAEAAAMVARLVRPELALAFTPKIKDAPAFDPLAYYLGVSADDIAIQGKDVSLSMGAYLEEYLVTGDYLAQLCAENEKPFLWEGSTINGKTFESFAYNATATAALQNLFHTTNPTIPYDPALALGAKHILVDTLEEATDLRAQLKAAGDSESTFTLLMDKHSTDPGSKSQPEGYTFGPGDMIEEFEAGTKALEIGQISEPIESSVGFHIILRIQPDMAKYKVSAEKAAFNSWMAEQEFAFSELLSRLMLPTYYDSMAADR